MPIDEHLFDFKNSQWLVQGMRDRIHMGKKTAETPIPVCKNLKFFILFVRMAQSIFLWTRTLKIVLYHTWVEPWTT